MTMLKDSPTRREIADRSWKEQASCRGVDTERWFHPNPPKMVRQHVRQVCSSCPMTRLCLSYALVNKEEFGAWGGLTMKELRPLQRRLEAGEALRSVLDPQGPETRGRRGSDAA